MIAGKTNVAPNMATTCWAPRPSMRGGDRRSSGRTTSPTGGVRPPWTSFQLNIDMTVSLPLSPV